MSREVNFNAIVFMFSTSALQHLGKVVNPITGKIEKNLEEARFVIDVLEILEEKTRGNLTKEEEEFLKNTLTNLRLNYIEEVKASTGSSNKTEDQENKK